MRDEGRPPDTSKSGGPGKSGEAGERGWKGWWHPRQDHATHATATVRNGSVHDRQDSAREERGGRAGRLHPCTGVAGQREWEILGIKKQQTGTG